MTLEKIKKQMLSFRDFYGGDLLNVSDIESATSKKDLYDIIERHRSHMEDMLTDASSHLDSFKRRVGLEYVD